MNDTSYAERINCRLTMVGNPMRSDTIAIAREADNEIAELQRENEALKTRLEDCTREVEVLRLKRAVW